MIDAAQSANGAGMLSAGVELIGAEGLGDALNAAQALGSALAQRGVYICPRGKAGACGNDYCPKPTLH